MKADFIVYSGDTKIMQVVVKNTNGEKIDLTGARIDWAVSRDVDTPPIITKTTPVEIFVLNTKGGVFEVAVESADTQGLEGVYYHEAQVTESDGTISTVFNGYITFVKTLIK